MIKTASVVEVPQKFRPHHPFNYPEDNDIIFEEWYFNNITGDDARERIYLPIFWTSYYCKYNFGKNYSARNELQRFINTLPKDVKYYTIVQYDDGILNDLSGLDVRIYAMSGNRIDYPLPLLCKPHGHKFRSHRRWLFNFIGKDTHPVRRKVFNLPKTGGYISEKRHTLPQFCKILAESVFTLCPRGYGRTSFRIAEAIQYGSIPVYISDRKDFIIPHYVDFEQYGILIDNPELTISTLHGLSDNDIKTKQALLPKVYNLLYTYESNKKLILKDLHQ